MIKRIAIALVAAVTSFGIILPLAGPAEAAPDSVCPASMPLGDVRAGIAAQDSATGSGYLLWSSEEVHTRFTPAPNAFNADHLIAVKYSNGQWLVDNNFTYTAFTPAADDCLVATLDFDNNTATTLENTSGVINGIDSGYVIGDLVVTPEQFGGAPNAGEFGITGTYIGDTTPPAPGTLTAVVDPGVVGEADGVEAASLTVTRSDVTANPVTVTVTSSDTTEADVASSTLTIPGGEASGTVQVDAIDDAIVDGTQTVTLTATAAGFDATSTTITVTDDEVPTPDSVCPAFMPLGDVRAGIAAQDSATGSGYLLWSSEEVHTRFTPAPNASNADHLIAVKYSNGQWLVDNNFTYTAFTPAADDCLVATLDFDNNTATTLENTSGVINGIDSGYVIGDLVVTPEQFGGAPNAGEFGITGTYIGDTTPPAPGTLTAVVDPGVVGEADGVEAASLTVTRSDVTANPVTVTVTSSDTTEADVASSTLTIPGGEASGTVQVDAIDDAIVDGTQTVTLTATAAGFDATSTTITVTDDEVPTPDSVCPAFMPLGDVRAGIAAQDSATGSGYLLWSSEEVHTRFTPAPNASNADHLIAVKYSNGQWLVDNNFTYTAFTPAADDCLVATLDFDNNTATTLENTSGVINGIDSGYVIGDLVVTPEQFGGAPNAGEFGITGTYIGDTTPPAPGTLTAVVDPGVVGEADGVEAASLTVTRSDVTANPVTVTVTSSDTTEADVASSTLTIPGGEASGTVQVDAIDDAIVDGTQTVTLTATAAGFDATSTTITVTDDEVPTPDSVCPAFMPLGDVRAGIAAQDSATGSGYLLWSSEEVHTRFTPAPNASNADHLIAVKYSNGQWLVDNNFTYTAFTPAADDCLVATLDFDNNTATTLENTSGVINGIDSGYVIGDLVVTPEQFGGAPNAGEFGITGTYIGDTTPPAPGTLTAVVDPGVVGEADGVEAASLTVTRSDVTANPVTVTVTSSDTTEADVASSTLTIPGGEASGTVQVDAIDDAIVDGTQTVTLTATAAGFDATSTTITVTDDEVPTPDSVCPAFMPLGDVRAGIAAQDSATGSGYLLWSSEEVHTRFTPAPNASNADHLIAVKYSNGQWLVDNNFTYTAFTPAADDCLVATLDFDNNTATTLENTSGVINGIDSGYVIGDLVVTPEQFGGAPNAGEFGITGTYIGDTTPPAPGTLTAVVDPGVVGEADGVEAASLTVTRSDVTANPVTVTVTSSDTTEADVASSTLTIPGGEASGTVQVDAIDDAIVDGTQTVTLTATAAGFDATSTTITVTDDEVPTPDSVCPAFMPLGDVRAGIAAQDSATGSGYLLWSSEEVHTRFTPAPNASNADHLIAVKYSNGQWLVDNNFTYTAFTPAADDCLVATLDFDNNTATTLENTSGVINGIDSGYVIGDLVVTPEQLGGAPNAGEFDITGTYIGDTAPPVAVDDADTTLEDTPVITDVTANDTGTIDPTSVTEVTAPSNGTITIEPVTGDITYTPNSTFNGIDTYEYSVCDNNAACDTATVTITVTVP